MAEKLEGLTSEDLPEKWERIDPEDKRYREMVEENKTETTRYLFGLHELNVVKSCDEESEKAEDQDSKLFYGSVKKTFLSSSISHLQKLASNPEDPLADVGFESLFYEVIDRNPEIKKRLKESIPGAFSEDGESVIVDVPQAISLIKDMALDLYEQILREHATAYAEKDKEFQERVPAMRSRFLERLGAFVSTGHIALNIKEVEKKASRVNVVAGDYLLYSDFTDADGDYNPENEVAVIPNGEVSIVGRRNLTREEHQEYVFTHEMFHAISGIAVLGKRKEGQQADRPRLQKSGLLLEGRFRWLNEAITERLALRSLNMKDSDAYNDERDLLEKIIDKGVPEDLFLASYFEDQKPGKGAPATNKLIRAINEKCGPRFIQELDEIIDLYGLDIAKQEMF